MSKKKQIFSAITAACIALSTIPKIKAETSEDFKNFLDYGGSEYGYNDLLLRSNPEKRQELYNDMYKECYKYSLANEKEINNLAFSLDMNLYGLSKDEIREVYNSFRQDHAEFYILSNYTRINFQDDKINLVVEETYTNYRIRKKYNMLIQKTVNEILESANKKNSLYDKVLDVHNSIKNITDYSYDENGNVLHIPFTDNIVGALDRDEKTKSVCTGYSKSFQLILNCLNIENIYVSGIITMENQERLGHAWNLVKMEDGIYYRVDVTHNDVLGYNLYFLSETESTKEENIFRNQYNKSAGFQYALPKPTIESYTSKKNKELRKGKILIKQLKDQELQF